MPVIFKFYIKHCVIGFGVSAVFISSLLYFNVANLWHLISTSDVGLLAFVVFWVLNGIVFAGVQTGVAIMLMADDGEDDSTPGSGSAVRGDLAHARAVQGKHAGYRFTKD